MMMLDEIDKMGRGVQGDPSAAMLEVLDPEQNGDLPRQLPRRAVRPVAGGVHRHRQHARQRSGPAAATAWRSISLAGYTEDEKLEIAQRYLVRRQLEANGLEAGAGRDSIRTRCG